MRRGDLRTRVPVVSADETGRLARSFNDMVAGLQERERLHEAFGAYVGPNVAEMVLRDGVDLDGEELQVSILCLDIRDFTRFAERASAREVVDRLNEFYELVVPLLVRHGGYPDKYVGDGLLGVFGAPEPIVAHADRAVAAAIEIARRRARALPAAACASASASTRGSSSRAPSAAAGTSSSPSSAIRSTRRRASSR